MGGHGTLDAFGIMPETDIPTGSLIFGGDISEELHLRRLLRIGLVSASDLHEGYLAKV